MVTTLRTLVANGVLRGRGLTDVTFGTANVTAVKLSSFKQAGDTFEQALARLSADTVVDLEGTTQPFANFDQGGNVYGLYSGAIIGYTNGTLQMTAGSSTHASAVNAQTTGTVQETLIRLGRGTSKATTPYFSATLNGTNQGHIYNGLVVYYCTNAIIENATFNGIPGTGSAPPYETTPLNNYLSNGTIARNVVVDGTNIGAGTAATGMLNSNCNGVLIQNSVFQDMGAGHGWAAYQTNNVTIEGSTFQNNLKAGINFEKCTGTLTMRNCTFHANEHDLIVDTDGTSAIVNIYDPVWDGMNSGVKFKVLIHTTYNYPPPAVSPNKQKASDIHLFQNGVEVTASKLQIVSS